MTRIVSVVPSVTETLLAWGVVPVGVTRFCEHDELPIVGGTKDPDIAAIVGLQPDVVVMCDEENRVEDATALQHAGVEVHVISIRSLAEVQPELDRLRVRIGLRPEVEAPPIQPVGDVATTAFIPIWRQARHRGVPRYHTLNRDTYGASLLAGVGVTNVFADLAERYAEVEPDEVRARAPDIVIAPSEPYPFGERHRRELSELAPVVFVDGQDLFWWGVRTREAMPRLAQVIGRRR